MSRDESSRAGAATETLERIADGVLSVDESMRYTYVNSAAAALFDTDPDSLLGSELWTPFPDGSAALGRPAVERALATGTEQAFQCPEHAAGESYAVRVFPGDGGATLLVTDVTDQRRYERTLDRLHEATRQMLGADEAEDIAELVSRAAIDILELPVNAVYFADDDAGVLVPAVQSATASEIVGEAPSLDSGLALDAYRTDETRVYPDLDAADAVFNAETPFRSELCVPLSGHGVFIVASTEPDAFSETDVTLATLLGANATVALDRVTSENRLVEQRDNLELLTRMMSHDIRNDLQVIGAVAELLDDHFDGRQGEYVEKIRRNTEAAVDLTTSAQELTKAMLRADAEPSPIALDTVLDAQVERVSETTGVAIAVDGELPSVTVLADEMLGSVFRNILKNAVQHNTERAPEVTVGVTVDGDTVSVAVADNGPGVPDEQKERIFGRGERGLSSQGTGIGLYLVETLTEQYGGHVRVEDNEPVGAVFVVELRRANV